MTSHIKSYFKDDVLCDALYLLTYYVDIPTSNNQNMQSMSLPTLDNSESCTKQSQAKKNINQIRPWLYRPKKSAFGNRRAHKYNDQHWSIQQNSKYLEFLILYRELFQSDTSQKRKYHLNRMCSKFVGTRSPIQCRSHHQRILKTYGSFQNIVSQMGQALKKETFQVQKSVRTNEVAENEEKSQQFKMLPSFQLTPFLTKRKDENFQIWRDVDSNSDMINNFFDL